MESQQADATSWYCKKPLNMKDQWLQVLNLLNIDIAECIILYKECTVPWFCLSFSVFIRHLSMPSGLLQASCFQNLLKFSTNVHRDSKVNWLEYGGQRSRSLWPHGIQFLWTPYLKNALIMLKWCLIVIRWWCYDIWYPSTTSVLSASSWSVADSSSKKNNSSFNSC